MGLIVPTTFLRWQAKLEEGDGCDSDGLKRDDIHQWLSLLPESVLSASGLRGVLSEVSKREHLGPKQMAITVGAIALHVQTVSQRLAHLQKASLLPRRDKGEHRESARRNGPLAGSPCEQQRAPRPNGQLSLTERAAIALSRDAERPDAVKSAGGGAEDFSAVKFVRNTLTGADSARAVESGQSCGSAQLSREATEPGGTSGDVRAGVSPATPLFELPPAFGDEERAGEMAKCSLDDAIKDWGAEQIRLAETTINERGAYTPRLIAL